MHDMVWELIPLQDKRIAELTPQCMHFTSALLILRLVIMVFMISTHSMDPYDRLVWEVWMPKLRQTILSWSPRICNPVIDLLQLWMPLIPEWIMNNILELLVMPRLQTEVDIWDPTTDTLPIHAWVHPWLPLMGECVGTASKSQVLDQLLFVSRYMTFSSIVEHNNTCKECTYMCVCIYIPHEGNENLGIAVLLTSKEQSLFRICP